MKLKMQIVRDGKVISEIPLSPADWQREKLEDEFKASEQDFRRLAVIFDALSHETRLRMMRRIIEEEGLTISFADFMRDLDLNPKIVWENSKKLTESGFLEKIDRGTYGFSEFGQTAFIMMSLALRHIMELLEETEEV
jgi:DNA-binding transcriptional ArsR family regulator